MNNRLYLTFSTHTQTAHCDPGITETVVNDMTLDLSHGTVGDISTDQP